jgi:hypothetical protein
MVMPTSLLWVDPARSKVIQAGQGGNAKAKNSFMQQVREWVEGVPVLTAAVPGKNETSIKASLGGTQRTVKITWRYENDNKDLFVEVVDYQP